MSAGPNRISEECSALAFYAIEPGVNAVESFYRTMVKWFNELGFPPDKIAVSGPGHTGKLVEIAHGAAKLEESGFREVVVVELVATTPDAKIWGRDYLLTASYDGRSDSLIVDV